MIPAVPNEGARDLSRPLTVHDTAGRITVLGARLPKRSGAEGPLMASPAGQVTAWLLWTLRDLEMSLV